MLHVSFVWGGGKAIFLCGINKVFSVLVISFIACNNDTDFIV